MHRKGLTILIFTMLFLLNPSLMSASAMDTESARESSHERTVEVEIEDLSPNHSSRQIDTVSLNILIGNESLSNDIWFFYYGLTLTDTSGYVNYQYPHRDSSAFGLGPVVLVRYEPLQWERFSVAIDMSGAMIFYNEDFPAGGDFYNFMWRLGPKFIYKFNDRAALSVGYKWMHVSNGQHEHNPAYDAEGITIGLAVGF